MKKVSALLFCFILYAQLVKSQDYLNLEQTRPQLPAIPMLPEAAAFAKYGDIPVNHATGVPSISIPIYTLTANGIEVPVSLQYHAGGFKVEEIATDVGLGWTLNGYGVISRSVVGMMDDFSGASGFGSYNAILDLIREDENSLPSEYREIADNGGVTLEKATTDIPSKQDDLYWGIRDGEPDLFYFNFPGGSGKFFIGKDRELHPFEVSNLQITRFAADAAADIGERFVITDDKGVKYTFAHREIQQNSSSSPFGDLNSRHTDEFFSNFYLSRIESPQGGWIDYEYQEYGYTYYTSMSQTAHYPHEGSTRTPEATTTYQINKIIKGLKIKKISSSTGYAVEFHYNSSHRGDLPVTDVPTDPETGLKLNSGKLESIVITKEGAEIKGFDLISYYYQGKANDSFHMPPNLPSAQLRGANSRLMLLEIQERGKESHKFFYNENNLPSRFSFGRDYWGYYNGKDLGDSPNTTLVPGGSVLGFTMAGGNRQPNATYMKAGMLEKIQYPTKGYTTFNFEPHQKTVVQDGAGYTYEWVDKSKTFNSEFDGNVNNKGEAVLHDFTIPSGATDIWVDYRTNALEGIGLEYDPTTMLVPEYHKAFSQTYIVDQQPFTGSSFNGPVDLSPGNYQLSLWTYYFNGNDIPVTTTVTISWKEKHKICSTNDCESSTLSLFYGGLRVKEIVSYGGERVEGGEPLKGMKRYEYSNPVVNHELYKLVDEAYQADLRKFVFTTYKPKYEENSPCVADYYYTSIGGSSYHSYHSRTSDCQFSLAFQSGGGAYYNTVSEYSGKLDWLRAIGEEDIVNREIIKKVYRFRNKSAGNERNFRYLAPLYAETDYSWLNGELYEVEDLLFNSETGTFQTQKKTHYYYTKHHSYFGKPASTGNKEIWGIKVTRTHSPFKFYAGANSCKVVLPTYAWVPYSYQSVWKTLDRTEEIYYTEGGISQAKSFFYDTHTFQVNQISTRKSDGGRIKDKFIYANNLLEQGGVYPEMVTKNMLSVPVYSVQSQEIPEHVAEGELPSVVERISRVNKQVYASEGGQIQHTGMYSSKLASPYTPAEGVDFSSDIPAMESLLDPEKDLDILYDAAGYPVQVEEKGVTKTYLWGYNHAHLVAEITNITYAEVEGIPNVGPATISSSNSTDDIRARLETLRAALSPTQPMATYLFKPGVGVSETIDVNGQRYFYVYDTAGRLVEVQEEGPDNERHTIKLIKYNYRNSAY